MYVTLPANETYHPFSIAEPSRSGDEKQWRTTGPSCSTSRSQVSSSASRVWMRREQLLLRGVRRVVAVVVEPCFADRYDLGMREELAQLVEVARIVGLVRMHAEARVHTVLALGARNDLTSAGDCRCNVDHLRDAGRARALQHL